MLECRSACLERRYFLFTEVELMRSKHALTFRETRTEFSYCPPTFDVASAQAPRRFFFNVARAKNLTIKKLLGKPNRLS